MKSWRGLIRLTALLTAVALLLVPHFAGAASDTRRPDAAGDETNLTPNTGANYTAVAEATTDEDTTYVYTTNTTYLTDLYQLNDVTDVTGKGKINSVTVWIRARAVSTPVQASAYTRIKTGGTAYDSSATPITLTTSYADYSHAWTTNPQTSAEWTWPEINSLQAGVGLRRATTTGGTSTRESRCTQVWVVVDYSTPTLESYKESGHTTVWGTVSNPYSTGTNSKIAYLYGSNYIKSHINYSVGYYENDGDLVITDTKSSAADNTLSSQYTLDTDITRTYGTWHAVVFDTDFGTPPGTYALCSGAAGYVVEDSFEVAVDAVPEIPTILAGIAVAGACFGIYYWMRKRRLKYVQT